MSTPAIQNRSMVDVSLGYYNNNNNNNNNSDRTGSNNNIGDSCKYAQWKAVKREFPEREGVVSEMEEVSSEDSRDNNNPGKRMMMMTSMKASDYEMVNVQEEEKRRMRRERNKLAAAKCRQRRVDLTNTLLSETEKLEDEKCRLEEEILTLERQKEELQRVLSTHAAECTNVKEEKPYPFMQCFDFRQNGSYDSTSDQRAGGLFRCPCAQPDDQSTFQGDYKGLDPSSFYRRDNRSTFPASYDAARSTYAVDLSTPDYGPMQAGTNLLLHQQHHHQQHQPHQPHQPHRSQQQSPQQQQHRESSSSRPSAFMGMYEQPCKASTGLGQQAFVDPPSCLKLPQASKAYTADCLPKSVYQNGSNGLYYNNNSLSSSINNNNSNNFGEACYVDCTTSCLYQGSYAGRNTNTLT